MKKTITILLLLAAFFTSAAASSYARCRTSKSSLRHCRTSIFYGRQSIGIGRQTMDMSSRRMELRQNTEGCQEVFSNGHSRSWYGNSSSAVRQPSRAVYGSDYSITEAPERVIGYQSPTVTVGGGGRAYSSSTVQARGYHVLSSGTDFGRSFVTGGSGGGSSSPVVYGRTGGRVSSYASSSNLSGLLKSPASMAVTTNQSGDSDGDNDDAVQGYAECPDVDYGPLGDAIIPLLLLISLFAIFKYRKSSI